MPVAVTPAAASLTLMVMSGTSCIGMHASCVICGSMGGAKRGRRGGSGAAAGQASGGAAGEAPKAQHRGHACQLECAGHPAAAPGFFGWCAQAPLLGSASCIVATFQPCEWSRACSAASYHVNAVPAAAVVGSWNVGCCVVVVNLCCVNNVDVVLAASQSSPWLNSCRCGSGAGAGIDPILHWRHHRLCLHRPQPPGFPVNLRQADSCCIWHRHLHGRARRAVHHWHDEAECQDPIGAL